MSDFVYDPYGNRYIFATTFPKRADLCNELSSPVRRCLPRPVERLVRRLTEH
jgi:hypothetical protein